MKDIIFKAALIIIGALLMWAFIVTTTEAKSNNGNNGNHGKNAAHSNHNNNGGHDNHDQTETSKPPPPSEPPLPPSRDKDKDKVRIKTNVVYTHGSSSSPLPPSCSMWRECSYDPHTNMISWMPRGNRAESKKACLIYLGY